MVEGRVGAPLRRSGRAGNVRRLPGVPLMMTAVPLDTPPAGARWDDSLVELYERHYDDLVRLAYLVSGQAAHAEEVVQDAFVRAQRSWSRVRDPLPYLRTAVVNGCRSLGRRQVLERDRRPRPPDPVPLGADELTDGTTWAVHATYCGVFEDSDRWRGTGPFTAVVGPTGDTLTGRLVSSAAVPTDGEPYTLEITGGTGAYDGATGSCTLDNHLVETGAGTQSQWGDFACAITP
jgi:Sigma-70 region 2